MTFTEPKYDNRIVDLAGDALIGGIEADDILIGDGLEPLGVVNNWRSAHAYPLNTFQVTLRNRAGSVDDNVIVAQRIKRLSSIEGKLRRYDWLKLSAMQDIAGARVIVSSVPKVYEVVNLYQKGYASHTLDKVDDYIKRPKSDGYRSCHLIIRYFNTKHPVYDGLKVEMQVRTPLQHAWATAVETIDTFYGQSLKSHQGSAEWRRFFSLMGAAIAQIEGTKPVPKTPRNEKELRSEIRACSDSLKAPGMFNAFGRTLRVIWQDKMLGQRIKYIILSLDTTKNNVTLFGYPSRALGRATAKYAELERKGNDKTQAVLVSVADAKNLQAAYPNYFMDTTIFLRTLNDLLA